MLPAKLAIVIPCHNEVGIIESSVVKLSALLNKMIDDRLIVAESGIICIDDGSKDGTWNLIEQLSEDNPHLKGVKLSRNFGQQNALLAGLSVAVNEYDVMVTLDSDLQDDITVIAEMLAAYVAGSEIVYGVRRSRGNDGVFKRLTARLFYNMVSSSNHDIIPEHADFRLMSAKAVNCLLEFPERNLFLRGLVPLLGLNSDVVYYDRLPRIGGESKYSLIRMLGLAVEGITSSSVRPIRAIFLLGVLFLIATLSVSVYVLISIVNGVSYPGWASIMLSLWLIGSLILISLGIIGEYAGKIYLEVKRRPRFIIEKRIGTKNK
ncbi:MAG: glycosyltransferase family 2 protein [Bacteroidales bacterium]